MRNRVAAVNVLTDSGHRVRDFELVALTRNRFRAVQGGSDSQHTLIGGPR